MKKILNAAGIGLVEVMLGFGLIGAGAFVILNGVDFISEKKSIVDRRASMEGGVRGLVESIRANIAMEKVDFNGEDFLSKTTLPEVTEQLKLCWYKDGIIPIEQFPNCPGRIGYVITTLKTGPLDLRGLYKVTIRLTHSELIPGEFKQYEFVVKDP